MFKIFSFLFVFKCVFLADLFAADMIIIDLGRVRELFSYAMGEWQETVQQDAPAEHRLETFRGLLYFTQFPFVAALPIISSQIPDMNAGEKSIYTDAISRMLQTDGHPAQMHAFGAVVNNKDFFPPIFYEFAFPRLMFLMNNSDNVKEVFSVAQILWHGGMHVAAEASLLKLLPQITDELTLTDMLAFIISHSEIAENRVTAENLYRNFVENESTLLEKRAKLVYLFYKSRSSSLVSLSQPYLREFAQDFSVSNCAVSRSLLRRSGIAEDKEIVVALSKKDIVNGAVTSGSYYSAIDLYENNDTPETKAIARAFLMGISSAHEVPEQLKRYGLFHLKKDTDPSVVMHAQLLKHSLFPIENDLDLETCLLRDQFNRAQIKFFMPKALDDLSAVSVDIVDGFVRVFDLMSPDEFVASGDGQSQLNPYYVCENTASSLDKLSVLKENTLSFLRVLVAPIAGETSAHDRWVPLETTRHEMINSLKHILRAFDLRLDSAGEAYDPAAVMTNLVLLLEGFYQCPTAQTEAVQSVVNTLIHFKNVASSELKEIVGGRVLLKTMMQQYNTVALKDPTDPQSVHYMSAVRDFLKDEFGFAFAMPSFNDNMLPYDQDAALIDQYQLFYRFFVPETIVEEFRRSLRSPAQVDAVLFGRSHQETYAIKQGYPLSVPMIANWLYANGVSQDQICTHFQIDEDWQAITNSGIMRLLVHMEFFNPNSERLMELLPPIYATHC